MKTGIKAVVLLFLLSVFTFYGLLKIPGSPFDSEIALNPLVQKNIENHWSQHGSFIEKYVSYVKSLSQGYLGYSITQPQKDVVDILKPVVKVSLTLGGLSLIAAFLFCSFFYLVYFVGLAKSQRTYLHPVIVMLGTWPTLFLAPVLIYIFSLKLKFLPVAELNHWSSYILPVICLALKPASILSLLLIERAQQLEGSDLVRALRARGLGDFAIYGKHILKNIIVPLVYKLPPVIVTLISGSFFVEMLFSIQGAGYLFIQSIAERDYPVAIAITLILALFIILLTTLAEIVSIRLDPRLRTNETN